MVYFTTDDSSPDAAKAALFADSAKNLPPFQKDGKTAYLACVFTCDGGKTTWVGYLERYTPEKLQQIQNTTPSTDQAHGLANMQSSMQGIQIKRRETSIGPIAAISAVRYESPTCAAPMVPTIISRWLLPDPAIDLSGSAKLPSLPAA